jgi:hypothetical protein
MLNNFVSETFAEILPRFISKGISQKAIRGLGYRANISEERHTKLLDQIWEKTVQPSNDESAYTRMLLNSLWVLPDPFLLLKKTPPIPVILAYVASIHMNCRYA